MAKRRTYSPEHALKILQRVSGQFQPSYDNRNRVAVITLFGIHSFRAEYGNSAQTYLVFHRATIIEMIRKYKQA